jgi:alanine-synthesizing transaminase
MFAKRTNWPSEENPLAQALRKHAASGKTLLDLTASNPTTCGFTYDETAIRAALASQASLRYEPDPRGLLAARQAVAGYYAAQSPAAAVNPRHLILTTGTSEAYSFLFRLLCEPGDQIAVAQPSYPLFEFLADIQDVRLRAFPLVYDHGWQIDFHALEGALGERTRAILLVHPNNPTGHFVSQQEAARLKEICATRELALIVDEVFLDYALRARASQRQPHGTFAANPESVTFTLSGLSKICALPQMKLGWIAASGPPQLVKGALERLEIIADTYLSLSTPLQAALPELLNLRGGIQKQISARIDANLRALDNAFAGQKLASRLEVEGGWYVVLRVPAVQSDEALAIRLLEEESVAVHPGHFFGFSSDGYLIVSLITPDDVFRKGMSRLLDFISSR